METGMVQVLSCEQLSTARCLGFTDAYSAENHPMDAAVRILLYQPENRPAAADFDVICVGTKAKHLQTLVAADIEI
jgi:hypothetical protein